MKRLAVLPVLVVGAVLAVPFVAGDHPVRWDDLQVVAGREARQLPEPVRGVAVRAIGVPGGAAAARDAGPVPATFGPDEPHPVTPVARRWQRGTPELGVQVLWASTADDTDTVVWAKSQRVVDYVVGLRANAVTISFPFFTRGLTADAVSAGPATPTPRDVEILAHEASLAGLRVTLRPILDEQSLGPPQGWRGNITPPSAQTWFDSYRAFLTPYLEVAQRQAVTTFVIGTELNSMETKGDWPAFVAAARSHFGGQIGYDLNWDNYLDGLGPNGFGAQRVDAYFPVAAGDDATPAEITRGWEATLAAADPDAAPRFVLSEVGIAARKGAFGAPGEFRTFGTYDPRIQPTWYRGVCDLAERRRLPGIYFWKVDFDADPRRPASAGRPNHDFVGHPASEDAVRECLSRNWPVPAGS